jgi:hypothetical protein
MANVSGAVQIETGIKHGLSIPFQSVAGEQSIDVGTLLIICISNIQQQPGRASNNQRIYRSNGLELTIGEPHHFQE